MVHIKRKTTQPILIVKQEKVEYTLTLTHEQMMILKELVGSVAMTGKGRDFTNEMYTAIGAHIEDNDPLQYCNYFYGQINSVNPEDN